MIHQAQSDRLDDAIDDFEASWTPESSQQIGELLKRYELSGSHEALVELIRIDIELRYEHDEPIELDDYLSRFGTLWENPRRIAEIAFEDFRSRSASGKPVAPSRWSDLPGIGDESWFQSLSDQETEVSDAPVKILRTGDEAFDIATQEMGFELVCQIGAGALSKVYLARQSDLAGRYVVLKVVTRTLAEPQKMARLQHTNIVPIYSFHRILDRSVICMPYAGRVTLHDFLNDQSGVSGRGGESLVATVRAHQNDTELMFGEEDVPAPAPPVSLPVSPAADEDAGVSPLEAFATLDCGKLATWLFQRLAGALAHSHARGVVHNDIKPSNVLIRNDGEPALLDFNLAQSLAPGATRHVGGTVAYMAPETYRALMKEDVAPSVQSDIYGLGVMLFEFVTGRLPYPKPESIDKAELEKAIQQRNAAPDWHEDDVVTPGLKAIISQCLRFEPEARYRSAESLQFDLQCEHQDLPLVDAHEPASYRARKWIRRHPGAISTGSILLTLALLVSPILIAAALYRNEFSRLQSQAAFQDLSRQSADVLSKLMADPKRTDAEKIRAAQQTLTKHNANSEAGLAFLMQHGEDAEQRRAIADTVLRHAGQLAFLEINRLQRVKHQGDLTPESLERLDDLIETTNLAVGDRDSRAVSFLEFLRADLADENADLADLKLQAAQTPADGDSEEYLEAIRRLADHDYRGSADLLESLADRGTVPTALRWTMLGRTQFMQGRFEDAALSFTQSIERASDSAQLRVLRGLTYRKLREGKLALEDFEKAIELDPDHTPGWLNAGMIHEARGNREEAIRMFEKVLELRPGNVHALLRRAATLRKMGDIEQANRDYTAAMNAVDLDVNELLARSTARRKTEPAAALADIDAALRIEPDRLVTKMEKAWILQHLLNRPDDAIEVYDEVLAAQESHEMARVDKAVLLARKGMYADAYREVQRVLVPPTTARNLFQASCVFALLPKKARHERALELLALSINRGYEPDTLDGDPDLESLSEMEGFRAIVRAYQLSEWGRPGRGTPPERQAD